MSREPGQALRAGVDGLGVREPEYLVGNHTNRTSDVSPAIAALFERYERYYKSACSECVHAFTNVIPISYLFWVSCENLQRGNTLLHMTLAGLVTFGECLHHKRKQVYDSVCVLDRVALPAQHGERLAPGRGCGKVLPTQCLGSPNHQMTERSLRGRGRRGGDVATVEVLVNRDTDILSQGSLACFPNARTYKTLA